MDELRREVERDLGPTPQEHRRILAPLTEEELVRCASQAEIDRWEHIQAKHSGKGEGLRRAQIRVMEKLAQRDEGAFREVFMSIVSRNAAQYWSHITDGHRDPPSSSVEDYLKALVSGIGRK